MKLVISAVALTLILSATLSAQDTVHVKTGWNIVGSVKAGAVPEVLSTIPDSLITSYFWGYTPGAGYESTDTLETGTGYWVKVREDGVIIFDTTPPVDSCKSKAFIHQGKLYHTLSIGNQCWMAENLDVGVMVTGTANQADNDTIEKYCIDNDSLNCVLYGGLYQWDEAMQYTTPPGTQGICPEGWHIPTLLELQTLSSEVGGAGNALKTVGQGTGSGAGTNTSGFSALLGGERRIAGGFGVGLALLWSSTEYDATFAYGLYLSVDSGYIDVNYYYNKTVGFSVRCLED